MAAPAQRAALLALSDRPDTVILPATWRVPLPDQESEERQQLQGDTHAVGTRELGDNGLAVIGADIGRQRHRRGRSSCKRARDRGKGQSCEDQREATLDLVASYAVAEVPEPVGSAEEVVDARREGQAARHKPHRLADAEE